MPHRRPLCIIPKLRFAIYRMLGFQRSSVQTTLYGVVTIPMRKAFGFLLDRGFLLDLAIVARARGVAAQRARDSFQTLGDATGLQVWFGRLFGNEQDSPYKQNITCDAAHVM